MAHTRGGLVEKHAARAADEGARHRERAPHPPRERVRARVGLFVQPDGRHHRVGRSAGVGAQHALEHGVVQHVLAHRERLPEHVLRVKGGGVWLVGWLGRWAGAVMWRAHVLRADAHLLVDEGRRLADRESEDETVARGRWVEPKKDKKTE